jgi:hypothetical protein
MSYTKAIKFSQLKYTLMRKRQSAFCLLSLIADRAKRVGEENGELDIGEALIGDWREYGASSERVYRSDKKLLEKMKISTFKTTNKGTIAKLIDKTIYDINEEEETNKTTSKRRTRDEQETTNKNIKEIKEEKEINKEKEIHRSMEYLQQLKGEELTSFTSKYHMSESKVLEVADTMMNYCLSTGKKYSDYRATMHNWLKREKEKEGSSGRPKKVAPDDHY